jgi:polyisoprenoid-binding protein YceI
LSMRYCFGVLLLCVASLMSPVTQAQQQKLVFDPARSEVHFTLGDVLHTVRGTFRLQQGEIVFNPAEGQASGAVVVDALSGQSGNSLRDGKMASFMEAATRRCRCMGCLRC